MIANSNDFKLSASIITTGTSCKPDDCAACNLLSPAINSYFLSWSSDFLTIKGCIIPLSLIELVNSSKAFFSNNFLG